MVINKLIRLSKSNISNKEIVAVKKVLKLGFLGMGQQVKLFENKLSTFFKRKVVCFNSGTAAIHVALQSCGIGRGDEVLVPSITYVATFQAISASGAKPVCCDINQNNLHISLKDIKKKITSKTKAIIPVHIAGYSENLSEIYKFAKKKNLRVIEDAAHAFGSKYKKKLIGSFGDIACFSFDGIKNITSGEGGCLVSRDKKIIKNAKDIRLLGVKNDTEKRYSGHRSWITDVEQQGWRYHMSDINAAIGIAQFKRFKNLSKKRRLLCKVYDERFKYSKIISYFDIDYNITCPHIYIIRIQNLKKREDLRKVLIKKNIQTGIHYYPNYKYKKFKESNHKFPNTEKIYKEILTLPLHPELNKKTIKYISDEVINLTKKKAFF